MTDEERDFLNKLCPQGERDYIVSPEIVEKRLADQKAWEKDKARRDWKKAQEDAKANDRNYHIPTDSFRSMLPRVNAQLKENQKAIDVKLTIGNENKKDTFETETRTLNSFLGCADLSDKELSEKLDRAKEKFSRYSQLSAEGDTPERKESYRQLATNEASRISFYESEIEKRSASRS